MYKLCFNVYVNVFRTLIPQLLTCTGLVERPVHMIGTSMGGLITAMYAGLYPNEIAFITLICPAGNFITYLHKIFS